MVKTGKAKKALAALLLVAVMVLALMPGMALAADEPAGTDDPAKTEETDGSLGGKLGKLLDKVSELGSAVGSDGSFAALFEEGGPLVQMIQKASGNTEQFMQSLVKALSDKSSAVYKMIASFREDPDQYVQDLIDKLSDKGSALYQAVQSAAENAMGENGSVNYGGVAEMIGLLLGGNLGSDADLSIDFYYPGDEVYQACRAYFQEMNKEFMDEGDVQFVRSTVVENAQLEDGSVRQLGLFTQDNYAADGSDMKCISGISIPCLFTLTQNEDGSWTVTDVVQTEDGDTYQESLVRMCEEMGTTVEEFYRVTDTNGLWEALDLESYLNEHPEIKRIEFRGEMLTAEELNKVSDELMTEYMNSFS